MSRRLVLLLVLPLLAPAAARGGPLENHDPLTMGGDGPYSPALPAPVPLQSQAPLQVIIDRAKVDLENHRLEVKLSRACSKVRIKVLGNAGALLAEVEKAFDKAPAGTPLVMTWTPASKDAVTKIEVYGYDTDGNWSGVAIIPWSVSIPHEDVKFETDSDVVRQAEVPKLEASLQKVQEILAKHAELGKITLFIVGHTDTVGTAEHNLTLSRKRARAIAVWFRGKGLKSPIAYEGLGEMAPLVKTGDEVDEPRNRRVDYILSLEPPKLPSAEFSWKTP